MPKHPDQDPERLGRAAFIDGAFKFGAGALACLRGAANRLSTALQQVLAPHSLIGQGVNGIEIATRAVAEEDGKFEHSTEMAIQKIAADLYSFLDSGKLDVALAMSAENAKKIVRFCNISSRLPISGQLGGQRARLALMDRMLVALPGLSDKTRKAILALVPNSKQRIKNNRLSFANKLAKLSQLIGGTKLHSSGSSNGSCSAAANIHFDLSRLAITSADGTLFPDPSDLVTFDEVAVSIDWLGSADVVMECSGSLCPEPHSLPTTIKMSRFLQKVRVVSNFVVSISARKHVSNLSFVRHLKLLRGSNLALACGQLKERVAHWDRRCVAYWWNGTRTFSICRTQSAC